MQGEEANRLQMPSLCPSFSSYSGQGLVGTAIRVCLESRAAKEAVDVGNGVDDEFEFVGIRMDHDASVSPGDGCVQFPVFDRYLASLHNHVETDKDNLESENAAEVPLGDLFRLEDPQSSSSSSEVDELEETPNEVYAAWTPGRSTGEMSPSGCKKSKSTGSSSLSSWTTKRWRIRDLLKRSSSDGKQSVVFLNPDPISNQEGEAPNRMINNKDEAKKKKGKKVSAHEKMYLRNKAMKEGDKRRSYLPYRQDLVGLFANTNGLGRTFPPF